MSFSIGNETFDIDLDKLDSNGDFGVMDPFQGLSKDWKKIVGLTHDLHDMRNSLGDIRLCFIAITVSTYIGVLIYVSILCCQRRNRRRDRRRRAISTEFADGNASLNNDAEATKLDWEELQTVKSSADAGFANYRYGHPSANAQLVATERITIENNDYANRNHVGATALNPSQQDYAKTIGNSSAKASSGSQFRSGVNKVTSGTQQVVVIESDRKGSTPIIYPPSILANSDSNAMINHNSISMVKSASMALPERLPIS